MPKKKHPRCTTSGNKKMFITKYQAISAAFRTAKRGTPARFYYHKECGHWHITSKVREG